MNNQRKKRTAEEKRHANQLALFVMCFKLDPNIIKC